MKAIISGIDPLSLERELSVLEPLTEFRDLRVYSFHGERCPALLQEIGRIRELEFRAVGAGRGDSVDLDPLDTDPFGYEQLLAWDPKERQCAAMLRYQRGARAIEGGFHLLRTASLFDYSAEFVRDFLPSSIELGRSVVSASAKRRRLGLFALWRGLGALVTQFELACFFGNVSVYADYPKDAAALLVKILEERHRPPRPLLQAKQRLRFAPDSSSAVDLEGEDTLKVLRGALLDHGNEIPLMLRTYLQLGTAVRFGETARDADFGDALEIALVVPTAGIRGKFRGLFGI